jgi:hypothetical protein
MLYNSREARAMRCYNDYKNRQQHRTGIVFTWLFVSVPVVRGAVMLRTIVDGGIAVINMGSLYLKGTQPWKRIGTH